jgi:hypothetical protein
MDLLLFVIQLVLNNHGTICIILGLVVLPPASHSVVQSGSALLVAVRETTILLVSSVVMVDYASTTLASFGTVEH